MWPQTVVQPSFCVPTGCSTARLRGSCQVPLLQAEIGSAYPVGQEHFHFVFSCLSLQWFVGHVHTRWDLPQMLPPSSCLWLLTSLNYLYPLWRVLMFWTFPDVWKLLELILLVPHVLHTHSVLPANLINGFKLSPCFVSSSGKEGKAAWSSQSQKDLAWVLLHHSLAVCS